MTLLLIALALGCGDSGAATSDSGTHAPRADAGMPDGGSYVGDAARPSRDSAPPDVDVPPHPRNPALESLEANTWMVLEEGGITFAGHLAYSGGAYDRVNHQFLIFGGGHWDGYHNDVLAFDVATGTWRTMYASDDEGVYRCDNVSDGTPGMILSSMLPASRHTYDQIEFMDHAAAMVMWSGPTYSGIWGCEEQTIPLDTWLYDFRENRWVYGNAARGPQPAAEAAAGAYDPVSRRYFAIDRDSAHEARFWSYDSAADAWTRLMPEGTLPPFGLFYDQQLTTDRRRGRLFRYPFVYDVASNTWSELAATGPAPEAYEAEAYDEANDVFVVPEGDEIRVYHVEESRWEALTPSGDVPPIAAQTYGRFFYDPVDKVHLLVTGNPYESKVYAYRYR